ncbi:hypothetical protein KXW52_005959, partial [Aspergillus fumigatus]
MLKRRTRHYIGHQEEPYLSGREPLDSLQTMGKWHLQCAWREAVAVEIDPIDAKAGAQANLVGKLLPPSLVNSTDSHVLATSWLTNR